MFISSPRILAQAEEKRKKRLAAFIASFPLFS
jgi:hypothetical protein